MDSDFKQIVLTFYERRALKKSRKPDVPVGKCLCLLRHGLVIEKTSGKPGEMPIGTGFCTISPRGIDYLAFRRDLSRERFWIPFSVSIVTTLLLNGILQLWS